MCNLARRRFPARIWQSAVLLTAGLTTFCLHERTASAQNVPYQIPTAGRSAMYGGMAASLPVKNARAEKAELQILTALNRTTSMVLTETPLSEFVDYFQEQSGLAVQIDLKSLNDANVATDTPLTRRLTNVTLRSALDMTLRDLDLKWVIVNDVLMITTKDVADDMTEVRVYAVRDLVVHGYGHNPDFNTLINLITNSVKPDSWSATGGPGSIERFPRTNSLVIGQTREVHEQIGLLLAQLRKAGGLAKAAGF